MKLGKNCDKNKKFFFAKKFEKKVFPIKDWLDFLKKNRFWCFGLSPKTNKKFLHLFTRTENGATPTSSLPPFKISPGILILALIDCQCLFNAWLRRS